MQRLNALLTALAICGAAVTTPAQITLTPAPGATGTEIKFLVNTTSATQPVTVDFGDGQTTYFTIDPNQPRSNRMISGTVKGATVTVTGRTITEFECEEMGLTGVSLGEMPNLNRLILSDNDLTRFELTGTVPLTKLDLSHNALSNSVSSNSTLSLEFAGETLTDLNLSYNTGLRCLHAGALEALVYLSAHHCPRLGSVFICAPEDSHPTLRSINLNNCDLAHFYPVGLPELRTLELAGNALASGAFDTDPFILGDYPKLTSLNVSDNPAISELDVTRCPLLEQLHVSGCSLSSLDLTQCPELITLSASGNNLSSLDLGNNKELNYLYLADNPISSLDFEKMLKIQGVDISGTDISRVNLYYCYYLKSFVARGTKLEFVDFNAQQTERMTKVDLRDSPGFTPLSMAYTVKTLPAARTTMSTDISLFLSGSHPEIADITYVTGPEMHWVCDSEGDGSASYPMVSATIQGAALNGERVTGTLDRLYPYGGLSMEYDLDLYEADGGNRFLLAQWEPEWFETVAPVTINLRRGIPVHVYPYPAEGQRFRSVTVNGKEIFSTSFIVDEAATIQVNFEDSESAVSFTTEKGRALSFRVATATHGGKVDIDWGTGTRTPYTGIGSYSLAKYDTAGTRIDGTAAGSTVTVYGDITALDLSCYGDVGEELFGLPNNHVSAINTAECPGLKLLNFYWNPVKSIDLSANPGLEVLDASYSAVKTLDISANPALVRLTAYANSDESGDSFARIDAIDIANHTALRYVDLHNQNLSALDLTGTPALTTLLVTNNRLTALDVTGNPALTTLRAGGNRLTALDLTANTGLTELILDSNDLTALELSRNTALEELSVSNNLLTTLDTRNLTELGYLYVSGNGLSAAALTDIYYQLPVRKPRESDNDPMAVKSNLIVTQAGDRAENDGEGADGSIARARQWEVNVYGTNSASATAYLDVTGSPFGSVTVTDGAGNSYTHGSKVPKYASLTITPSPAPGNDYLGFRLNGEALDPGTTFIMPGIYTVLTPVFTGDTALDSIDADSVRVFTRDGDIVVEAQAASATVFGADGRLAREIALTGGRGTLPGAAPGIYIVRVATGGAPVVKTVIVK